MAKRTETLSTTEVAEVLDVHRNTILNWIKSERLRPDLVTFGGHARFRWSTVTRLQKKLGRRTARAA